MRTARANHSDAPAAPAGGARAWKLIAVPLGNALKSRRGWGCGSISNDLAHLPVNPPDIAASAGRGATKPPINTKRRSRHPSVLRATLVPCRRLCDPILAKGAGALLWCAATVVCAEAPLIGLPSGMEVTLHEVLLDPTPTQGTDDAPWARFRFVAPALRRDGNGQTHADAAADMDHLCSALVRPYLELHQLAPARVIISLANGRVPFGQASPDASQFFDSFRLVDGACVWEGY